MEAVWLGVEKVVWLFKDPLGRGLLKEALGRVSFTRPVKEACRNVFWKRLLKGALKRLFEDAF